MKEARKRHVLAKTIENFIRIADRGHVSAAAQLCFGHEIPFDTTHRVLLKPKQRRKS